MIEVAGEGRDGPLKEDVVFPERVVCVDEQSLAGRELGTGGHEAILINLANSFGQNSAALIGECGGPPAESGLPT
jgi:hypothetical protein